MKDFLNERLESDTKLYNKYAIKFAFFVIFPENIYSQQYPLGFL